MCGTFGFDAGVFPVPTNTITITYAHPFAVGTTTYVKLSGGSANGTILLLGFHDATGAGRQGGEASVIGTNTGFVVTVNGVGPGRYLPRR